MQLDRLEENHQKQKALEGKQHDVAVGTSALGKSSTQSAAKVSAAKLSGVGRSP